MRVRFEPLATVPVMLKGQPVMRTIELKSDGEKHGRHMPAVGNITPWVHGSGARRAMSVRDEHREIARSFVGFGWFPVQEQYSVTARFIKDLMPHEVTLPNLSGDKETYKTEGVVEFTINGSKVRLRPMTTRPGRLYFIFKDAA